jgi:hypothetical protein
MNGLYHSKFGVNQEAEASLKYFKACLIGNVSHWRIIDCTAVALHQTATKNGLCELWCSCCSHLYACNFKLWRPHTIDHQSDPCMSGWSIATIKLLQAYGTVLLYHVTAFQTDGHATIRGPLAILR